MDRQANLYLPEVRTLPPVHSALVLSLYHPALYNPILGGTLSNQQAPSSTRANRPRHYRPASCGIKKKDALIRGLGIRTFCPIPTCQLPYSHTPLLFSPSSTPLLLCDGVSCSTFLASKDEGGGKEIVRVGGFDVEVTLMQNTTCYHYCCYLVLLLLLLLLLLGLPPILPASTALLVQPSIAGFSY